MTREKAIKIIKEFMRDICLHSVDQEALETLIPELKDSEDERIRKEIIKFIQDFCNPCDPDCDKWIAYLEKQKEEEGYEAIPVESTLEYKLGFKAGKESEKQKEQKLNPDKEELIRHCIGLILTDATDERFKDYGLTLKDCLTWMGEQKEQKPAEWKATLNGEPIPTENQSVEIPLAEWGEEDKEMLKDIISGLKAQKLLTFAHDNQGKAQMNTRIDWLQSLPERFNLQPKQEWSEGDERIRKEIYNFFKNFKETGTWKSISDVNTWLAYLEKQKEQKPSIFPLGLGEVHWNPIPSGKDVHKWNLPEDFEEAVYKVANFISPFDSQEELRKVSHRFAEQLLSLAKKELDKPAEWSDEDEKYLNRVINLWVNDFGEDSDTVKWLKSLRPQPKQEWNEEDERMLSRCVKSIESSKQFADSDTFKKAKDNEIDWLENRIKSFRPVKQEWSKEDEKMLKWAIRIIVEYSDIDEEGSEVVQNWLESLHPQYHGDVTMTEAYKMGKEAGEASHWKPNDEQLRPLEYAIDYFKKKRNDTTYLESLYNDLKKL